MTQDELLLKAYERGCDFEENSSIILGHVAATDIAGELRYLGPLADWNDIPDSGYIYIGSAAPK